MLPRPTPTPAGDKPPRYIFSFRHRPSVYNSARFAGGEPASRLIEGRGIFVNDESGDLFWYQSLMPAGAGTPRYENGGGFCHAPPRPQRGTSPRATFSHSVWSLEVFGCHGCHPSPLDSGPVSGYIFMLPPSPSVYNSARSRWRAGIDGCLAGATENHERDGKHPSLFGVRDMLSYQ